jgi:hypothetical protein
MYSSCEVNFGLSDITTSWIAVPNGRVQLRLRCTQPPPTTANRADNLLRAEPTQQQGIQPSPEC